MLNRTAPYWDRGSELLLGWTMGTRVTRLSPPAVGTDCSQSFRRMTCVRRLLQCAPRLSLGGSGSHAEFHSFDESERAAVEGGDRQDDDAKNRHPKKKKNQKKK